MYVFQESPQRHKVPVILGRQSIVTPKTARLRSDQNTRGNTYIVLMPLLYLFKHVFEIKGPSELLLWAYETLAPCSQDSTLLPEPV